jgi:hypothetical protein
LVDRPTLLKRRNQPNIEQHVSSRIQRKRIAMNCHGVREFWAYCLLDKKSVHT